VFGPSAIWNLGSLTSLFESNNNSLPSRGLLLSESGRRIEKFCENPANARFNRKTRIENFFILVSLVFENNKILKAVPA
jgi:hypothetical protein